MIERADCEEVERLEVELDQFIERRAREAKAQRETEEMWAESVRRFHRSRHHENARAWYDHHDRQLASHEATFGQLVAYHQGERARYAEILGLEVDDARDDGPPEAA